MKTKHWTGGKIKMMFIIRGLLFLFVSIMSVLGIYFTFEDKTDRFLLWFKIFVLILASTIFLIYAIQDLKSFIKQWREK